MRESVSRVGVRYGILKKMLAQSRDRTVAKRHRFFYMWGVSKYFEGFEDSLEVLLTVLITFSITNRNQEFAFLLKALCSSGDRLFKESINHRIPPYVFLQGWAPPLFNSFKDKLAFTFFKCHFCLRRNVYMRCEGFVSFSDATEYSAFACQQCLPHGVPILLRTPLLTASNRLLFTRCAPISIDYVKHILKSSIITARHLGKHIWTGTVDGKRTSECILLTNISIENADFLKPLQLQLPMRKSHHGAAFGKGVIRNSTVNNFKPIFAHSLLRGGGHAIVDKIVNWPTKEQTPRKRRKTTPVKLKCNHKYVKPFRGAVLKSCTFCRLTGGSDDEF